MAPSLPPPPHFKDFERLVNGSMEYSTVEQPNYRTCVEKASKFGDREINCSYYFEIRNTEKKFQTPFRIFFKVTPS